MEAPVLMALASSIRLRTAFEIIAGSLYHVSGILPSALPFIPHNIPKAVPRYYPPFFYEESEAEGGEGHT